MDTIPGTCVQYPGLQAGGARGDALTPGAPAGSMAASAHGGRAQPRCRGVGGVGWGMGCRRRHRSGGRPPAWRNAHGRGRHPAAQRTCLRQAGRPTRHMGGRVGPTAARRSTYNCAIRWRQQPPTRRRNRRRRAGTISRGSSWSLRSQKVAARGGPTQLGTVGGGREAGAVRAL